MPATEARMPEPINPIKQLAEERNVDVEDQHGPGWSDAALPPREQERLAKPAPLKADEDYSLEPETYVYSDVGFPVPPNHQGGDLTIVVQAGLTDPHNRALVIEPPIMAAFPVSGRRYTTPTVQEQSQVHFDILRRQGKPVEVARAEAPQAAALDIRRIKRKIETSIEYRTGRIRKLAELQAVQPMPTADATATLKALADQGVDVTELLRKAGVKIGGPIQPQNPATQPEQPTWGRRVPAPPMS